MLVPVIDTHTVASFTTTSSLPSSSLPSAFPSVMPGGLNGVPQIFVFDRDGQQVFYRRKYHAGDLEALEEVLARESPRG